MRFGPVPLDQALGGILAHSVMAGGRKMAKGRVLAAPDIARLAAEGVSQVTVAQLDPGDVDEDTAATRLAAALVSDEGAAGLARAKAFTGRVNLNATRPGVLEMDAAAIHALNRIDPAITLATLAPWQRVTDGMLAGTVKIIAYGVSGVALDRACAVAAGGLRVRPVTRRSAGLILSAVPGQPEKLNAKARRVIATRLAPLGIEMAEVREVPHSRAAIAAALAGIAGEMVLILTGSATSDLHDVGPEGLRDAGGQVARFGMPVDPGNLLFHGTLGSRPVVGLPGCARSPLLNGADWVLERLACGIAVDDDAIAAMGVGGLLKEIPSRPQPREQTEK